MTASGGKREELHPVDVLLGQCDAEADREHRDKLRREPGWAVEVAETVDLLERMRGLQTEPSGSLTLRLEQVRHQAWLRTQRSRLWAAEWQRLRFRIRGVLAVAAILFTALVVWNPLERARRARTAERQAPEIVAVLPPERDDYTRMPVRHEQPSGGEARVASLIDAPQLPPVSAESEPGFHLAWDKFEDLPAPDTFTSWIRACNDLAVLQQEYRHRFSPQLRRRAIRAAGGNPDVDDRVQDLAATVAERINEELDSGEADALATSLSLRALLAAGSTTRFGRHRETVVRCVDWLTERVTAPEDSRLRLHGGELASALSALGELAVWSGGETVDLVREHTNRLVVETLTPVEEGLSRPGLLHWKTQVASLGDAGRLLQLAPAFGVHPTDAFRARKLVVAHLQERLDKADAEPPGILAAQLYGFSDLVDRDYLDYRLALWRPSRMPDYVALHHLAWAQFPTRPGWTRFQQQLRGLAVLATPSRPEDCAALLLCLAMNYAAPGMSQITRSAE